MWLAYRSHNNVTEKDEYPYGNTSTPWRKTFTTYQTGASYTQSSVHLISLPTQETVTDGGGNAVAQTTYAYDQNSLAPAPNITSYDSTLNTTARGNITTVGQWLQDTVNNIYGTLSTLYGYDIAGNIVWMQDPRGVWRQWGYSDATPNCANCSYAFPTSIRSYTGLSTSGSPPSGTSFTATLTWGYKLGKPLTTTDVNNNVTGYCYGPPTGPPNSCPSGFSNTDGLDRLWAITRPAGTGSTWLTYNNNPGSLSTTTNVQRDAAPSWITTTVAYDGLGRKSSTSLSLDSGAIVTTYAYDGRGRLAYTSLAWSGTPPVECVQSWGATLPTCTPNYGTFTSFDAVNRPTAAIQAGGATTTSQYIADETLITDPAGAAKLQTADRFGNLTAVVEDPSSWYGGPLSGSHVPYSTSYAYDPLSNLTAVTQTGMSTTPQNQWRNRNFSYDTLKRLVKAVNPESGAIYYSYDNSGNPLWRQDALGNLTNTPYDGLNRITAKNYVNNGVTPTVTYSYNDSPSGCAAGNQCARLIAVTAGNASTTYASYDAMGRVTSSTQSLGSLSYGPFSYQYNLAGALWTETYPSGLVVTNSFDAAGRVTQVAGNAGVNYAPSVSYVPQGVNVLTLGNGLTETWSYLTAQKQATGLVASALQPDQSYKVNASWSWGYGTPATDNGNVTSASVYKTDWTGAVYVNATQSFGYDLINRLTSSSESSGSPWTRNFGYDAWGNGWVWSFSGITPSAFTPLGTQTASSNFDSNNRLLIQGSAYNGAGNQTTIGGFTNVYDAENRMVTSAIGGVTTQYTYDGDGRRVQKVTGGTTTNYVYDAGGQLAAEYSSAAAQASACGTCYLTADTLGSTRMITDETATPRECHDYLPFGDEIGRTAGCYAGQTSNTLKFTGKERDVESGLDYFGARYLSSAQGRWTSPDWSARGEPVPYADLHDPQSLNLYA